MLIDWFTVAAQAVNFLVLVWLLKRFLYQPVLDAIDAREKHVATQLADAAAKRAKADEERASYEARNREFSAERQQLLSAARSAAQQERAALLQQARAEYEQLQARFKSELAEERDEITRAIVSRVLTETFAIARKLLGDLSDRNLEERIVEIFVRRIHSLSDAERSGIAQRLAGGDPKSDVRPALTVRSAFELSPAQRASIDRELECVMPDGGGARYDRAPELIGGIELTANGYRLRWSIEDYLVSLREQIDAALKPAGEI